MTQHHATCATGPEAAPAPDETLGDTDLSVVAGGVDPSLQQAAALAYVDGTSAKVTDYEPIINALPFPLP
jgi:hypothetical protein